MTLHAPHKVVTFVRPSSYTVKASPDYCSTIKNIHFLQLRNVLMSNTRFASKSVLFFSSTKPIVQSYIKVLTSSYCTASILTKQEQKAKS